jgi:hypothetical protein
MTNGRHSNSLISVRVYEGSTGGGVLRIVGCHRQTLDCQRCQFLFVEIQREGRRFYSTLEWMDLELYFENGDLTLPIFLANRLQSSKKPSGDRLGRLRQLMVERRLDSYLIVDSQAHYAFDSQPRQDRRISLITNSNVFLWYVIRLIIGPMRTRFSGTRESGVQTT